MSTFSNLYPPYYNNTHDIENYYGGAALVTNQQQNNAISGGGGETDFSTAASFYAATTPNDSSSMIYQHNNTDAIYPNATTDMTTFDSSSSSSSVKTEIGNFMLLDALNLITATPYYPTNTNNVYIFSSLSSEEEQQASPCPSASSSSLDYYYEVLDYFMTPTSPVSSLLPSSSSCYTPAPSLSPELTDLSLLPTTDNINNSINSNNYCDLYPTMENNTAKEQFTKAETAAEATAAAYSHNGIQLSLPQHRQQPQQKKKKQQRPTPEKRGRQVSPTESTTAITSDETKKKIYPCHYCNRSFARSYDASRHMRVHNQEKPYICPCCNKGFSRSDARVRHFRTEVTCRQGPQLLALSPPSTKKKQQQKQF